jgi:DNA replication protein DnaC
MKRPNEIAQAFTKRFAEMVVRTKDATTEAKKILKHAKPIFCRDCSMEMEADLTELARQILTRQRTDHIPCIPCFECSMRQMMTDIGVPRKMAACSFQNFDRAQPIDRQAWDDCVAFSNHTVNHPVASKRHTIILASPENGTGKSHLAVSMLRRWIQDGSSRPMQWISHLDLTAWISKTYHDGIDPGAPNAWKDDRGFIADPRQVLGHRQFLVLDDLGQDSGRKDEHAFIESILTKRDDLSGWTVITTNKTPEAFADWLGPRLADRVIGSLWKWVTLGNVSRR